MEALTATLAKIDTFYWDDLNQELIQAQDQATDPVATVLDVIRCEWIESYHFVRKHKTQILDGCFTFTECGEAHLDRAALTVKVRLDHLIANLVRKEVA
jgi:hypothetical protein